MCKKFEQKKTVLAEKYIQTIEKQGSYGTW